MNSGARGVRATRKFREIREDGIAQLFRKLFYVGAQRYSYLYCLLNVEMSEIARFHFITRGKIPVYDGCAMHTSITFD